MINTKTKKAFSMITAIFVIVIMSAVTALIMNVTGKTLKETTQQYQKEQAALLARSYTELAIWQVLNYDRTVTPDCLTTFNRHFGDANNGYDILVNIKYLGNATLLNGCNQTISPNGGIVPGTATWVNNNGIGMNKTISLVIDTYVRYKDFDDPSASVANGNRRVTLHRRTLQKL